MKLNKPLLLATVIAATIFIFLIVQVLQSGFMIAINQQVEAAAPEWRSNALTILSKTIDVALETWVAVLLSLILAAFLWLRDSKKDATLFALVMIADGILVFIFKIALGITRPVNGLVDSTGMSFPSGHTATATALFCILLYFALTRSKSAAEKGAAISGAVIMPLLTAFTRVYLGVHWLTDVLGGLALGVVIVGCGILIFESYFS